MGLIERDQDEWDRNEWDRIELGSDIYLGSDHMGLVLSVIGTNRIGSEWFG
jgi:hypothetical protein